MAKEYAKTNNGPTHEEIAQRAYEIFEQSGRAPGRDLENWLAAETQLAGPKQEMTSRTDSRMGSRPLAPRATMNGRA